jgi:hypothetical protein
LAGHVIEVADASQALRGSPGFSLRRR